MKGVSLMPVRAIHAKQFMKSLISIHAAGNSFFTLTKKDVVM